MRVNVYAEEMTDSVEVISKEIDGTTFTGLRFYLQLPATVDGKQYQGPFMHRPGDDDSAAVTFWGKRDLRTVLQKALNLLEQHYVNDRKDAQPAPSADAAMLAARAIADELLLDPLGSGTARIAVIIRRHAAPRAEWQQKAEQLEKLINTPELVDFSKAVLIEAVHQRNRWGDEHDQNKAPFEWLALLVKLQGKIVQAVWDGNLERLYHHIITTAAVCNNWHARLLEKHGTVPPLLRAQEAGDARRR